MVFVLLYPAAYWVYCSCNHSHDGWHMAINVLLLLFTICSWHASIVSLLTLVIHEYVIPPYHLHDVCQQQRKLMVVVHHDMLAPILLL